MNPDGWTPDVPLERFWDDLLARVPPSDLCPACSGAGIMSHVSESEVLWSMSCPCCGGDGLVTIVPGRKGTA